MPNREIDAVRTDGGVVHIRPLEPTDRDALRALNARVSDSTLHFRFFSLSRHTADDYVEKLTRPANGDRETLVALVGGELVGVCGFERLTGTTAEFAVLIDDRDHNRGIGTLLLEHLIATARRSGIARFVGDVLVDNSKMLKVIDDLGFDVTTHTDFGTTHVSFDIDPTARYVAGIDDRDRAAEVASLRPLLAPHSVAVVGASTRPNSVGHQILRNILDGGFAGAVFAVNPHHAEVLGVPAVATPLELPVAPDLAVVAVPAPAVPDVVRECGERGVRGIVLVTAGFGETGAAGGELQHQIVSTARQHDLRLIGPNCLGVVNTDPAVRLNATFARLPMEPGGLGLVSQSGALGIAVLAAAQRRGLGISQFVSVGNKADVSGNDLLLAWDRDPRTAVIALYLESFGNPRKFARLARRVSRRKPIIAIKAGRSLAGQRAGQSHTAAAASSDAVVDAMFTQAGVLRVETMEQMLDVARVLSQQPLPAGPRVAIIGNSGGPGILAADAAEAAGLTVAEFAPETLEQLRTAIPSAASAQNPIDLGAGAQPELVRAGLDVLVAAADIDAVLTVFTDTLVADSDEIMRTIADAAKGKPVVAVQVGTVERSVDGVPVFAFPEPAAAALGYAHRYAEIRAAEPDEPERPTGINAGVARNLVDGWLASGTEWLSTDEMAELLEQYGISMTPHRVVTDTDAAVRAAAELGYPVAVKVAHGVVHKTDVGGVRLNVPDAAALRDAVTAVQTAAASPAVLIQPMARPGTELIAGALQDPQFGPLVMVGAGGVLADLIADRQLRLAPLTAKGADQMISSLRTAALLDGYRGRPIVERRAVSRLLQRLAALADDLPEVAELDLNPVICSGGANLAIVDAKVRIAVPQPAPNAFARALRAYP